MKTAYIELNTTDQIRSLSHDTDVSSFSICGYILFPQVKVTSLPEILAMDFDYFVIDMSIITAYTAREFVKCNHRFLVCSLCEWKKADTSRKLKQLFQQTNISQEAVTILNNLCKKSTVVFSDLPHLQVIPFPFIQDPFQLEPKEFAIFSNLLARKIY